MDIAPNLNEFGWCPFANLTGKPCVVCGGTRAVLALCRWDLQSAWNFHPIVTILTILSTPLIAYFVLRIISELRSGNGFELKELLNTVFGRIHNKHLLYGGMMMWIWNIGRW